MQGGFVNGVKVKKVEERDSVLGSVGGAREQTPKPRPNRPPSRSRDGNWDLDCDASGPGSGSADGPLSYCSLLLQHLAVASDRHESHELGATKAAARVLQPYLDALASLPASVHLKCQITVQPSPACHLTCWDPLNREWR